MEQEFNTNYNKNNVRIYSLISYVGFLFIVGLIVQEKDDELVRFHVGQGIVLFVFTIILSFVIGLIKLFANILMPDDLLVSMIIASLEVVLNLVKLVFMGIGVYNACSLKKEKLPIIGNLAFYK